MSLYVACVTSVLLHAAGVATVAREVENAMNGNNPYVSKKDDYLGKARQLVFNLKKNDQLR